MTIEFDLRITVFVIIFIAMSVSFYIANMGKPLTVKGSISIPPASSATEKFFFNILGIALLLLSISCFTYLVEDQDIAVRFFQLSFAVFVIDIFIAIVLSLTQSISKSWKKLIIIALMSATLVIFSKFMLQSEYIQSPNNPEVLNNKENISNYKNLEQELKKKRWIEAEKLTNNIFREPDEILDTERTTCSQIKEIDFLWRSNSNNRFGLRAQLEIWISQKRNTDAFREKVGWKPLGTRSDDYYENFVFSLEAPRGHLPTVRHVTHEDFLPRVEECIR